MNSRAYVARFLFSAGKGLVVGGDALDRTCDLERDGHRVVIRLPGPNTKLGGGSEHFHPLAEKSGVITVAQVAVFEVAVEIPSLDVEPEGAISDAIERTQWVAWPVAEEFLGWFRLEADEPWLLASHEAPELYAPGLLYDSETNEPLLVTMTHKIGVLMPSYEGVPGQATLAAVFGRVHDGPQRPPIAESLLLDARQALGRSNLLYSNTVNERPDAIRIVLLAAIASEVKIKTTLHDRTKPALKDLVDLILESQRGATGQLTDKVAKVALGRSLREDNLDLYRRVTDTHAGKAGLFPLRNKVAHHGHEPGSGDAEDAVDAATELFVWLDGF